MKEALKLAGSLGYKAVFLARDPNYYNKFGFVTMNSYGILSKTNIPEQFTLVYEIKTNYLINKQGVIDAF